MLKNRTVQSRYQYQLSALLMPDRIFKDNSKIDIGIEGLKEGLKDFAETWKKLEAGKKRGMD